MFDRHYLEARFALGLIHPEDLSDLAVEALIEGCDGTTIRRIAATTDLSGWEFDQLRPAFVKETGLDGISVEDASVRIAVEIAAEALKSDCDVTRFAFKLDRLALRAGYPKALCEVAFLEEEIWIARHHSQQAEAEIQTWARERLQAFMDTHSASESTTR